MKFEFRTVPYLDRKPISSPDSPDRKGPGGPFANPHPEEIITDLGSSHRLMLNKYCIYRPMLVLPTIKFAAQNDDLDLNDITAGWTVMKALSSPYLVIFNGGPAGGSSLGHKHLQVIPYPDKKRITLFPSLATSQSTIVQDVPNVHFKHFIHRIPSGANSSEVFRIYQVLLLATRHALQEAGATDCNVAFTTDWIVLIPRRTAVGGGPFGANAPGMLGMVTVPNQEQRQRWADLGYTDYLVKLGIPINDVP